MSVILVNGRGQLGAALKNALPSFQNEIEEKVYVYHTWNIEEKSEEKQKIEYEKFRLFVEEHTNEKIIFISTYSEKENWYNHYKQMAEAFLSLKCKRGVSLRIPTIIGKGTLRKIKNNKLQAYGQMEIITLEKATTEIIKFFNYDGIIKSFRVPGEKILATTVEALIKEV
jgi:mRNA-degrading endonuclease RelE of RelBE toxin-antitoxin system